MTLKGVHFLLIIMIFALAGCFRQASDSIDTIEESDSGQAIQPATMTPQQDTLVSPTNDDNVDTEPTAEAQATDAPTNTQAPLAPPTEPPVEAITNTPAIAVTASTPVPIITDTPAPTATPMEQTTDDQGDGVTDVVPLESPSPTFVTPMPSGPSTNVSTPTSSALEDPNGAPTLVTPTEPGTTDTGISEDCIYTVQTGDTVYRIALANNTTVDEIVEENPGLSPSLIRPGDEIILPDCGDQVIVDSGGDDDVDDAGIIDNNVGPGGETVHVVQSGETLSVIAQRYGVTITAIVQANELINPDRLSIGQELIIPQP